MIVCIDLISLHCVSRPYFYRVGRSPLSSFNRAQRAARLQQVQEFRWTSMSNRYYVAEAVKGWLILFITASFLVRT